MEAHTQYSCNVCGNLRTYGTGWPDDPNQIVIIQCGKCKCYTPHKYEDVGHPRLLGGLPEKPVRL